MEKQTRPIPRSTIVDLFNSVLAGKLAGGAFSEALHRDWLPAMASVEERTYAPATLRTRLQRLVVRLGWLLEHLPRAASIHPGLLDRAIRECRAECHALAALLFADERVRTRQCAIVDEELLGNLRVTSQGHDYCARSPRRAIAPARMV